MFSREEVLEILEKARKELNKSSYVMSRGQLEYWFNHECCPEGNEVLADGTIPVKSTSSPTVVHPYYSGI